MSSMVVVVPCFNEEKRLRPAGFQPLFERASVLFVDNGSTDGTSAVIAALCKTQPRAALLRVATNGGKAEAVRLGMRKALEGGAQVTGFLDADLAAPAGEMLRVLDAIEGADVALGSRQQRPGARIERPPVRRVLGRVFALAAARVIGLDVTDTQCGAKAFRAGAPLTEALARPFSARWAFDVELLGRLLQAGVPRDRFVEVPLGEWRDVGGSKLRAADFPRMGLELWRIRQALRVR